MTTPPPSTPPGLSPLLEELVLLVRSGHACLALRSPEETRSRELLEQAAARTGRKLFEWSMTSGWSLKGTPVELGNEGLRIQGDETDRRSPFVIDALSEVMLRMRGRPSLFLLHDLEQFFDEPKVLRKLRDVFHTTEDWAICFVAPSFELPPQLEKEITIVDVPLPDEDELRELLVGNLRILARDKKGAFTVSQTLVERVVRAALGLTRRQADRVFRMAIKNDDEFSEEDLDLIAQQKRQVIAKSGVLEYREPEVDLDGVGGLDGLKAWLAQRSDAFSDRARQYGLPQPKGVFLLGVQGCGKSLVSKAIASYWHVPLLRLDVGALFSSYIGKSEENLRNSLKVAESVAPCVLWVDEIEKGFAGVAGSGKTDGGTTSRIFGTFITWMQEKTRPVFVVATANSITDLPPELLRKGRFDEIFFVDLPTLAERQQILAIQLQARGRHPAHYDLSTLAQISEGFSGAELEQAIVAAMYRAFPQDREFATPDVQQALQETVPISRTMADSIGHLRSWARQRARWATTQGGGQGFQPPPRSATGRLLAPPPRQPG